MLKRKMYDTLLEWKNAKRNTCLILKGARQVGKTYLVEQFGKNEYESFIEINFVSRPEMKEIFEGSLSAGEIYKRISAYMENVKLIPGKTLIFLDEIQKCANARTALKFLAEDKTYDVIASGSLLGLAYYEDDDKEVTEVSSIPVGYEEPVVMYSMDFEEFLWAYGYSPESLKILKSFYENEEKIPSVIAKKYEELVREYIVVGGMPEVVADFMEFKDFNRVQYIQEKIFKSYEDDISKHARGVEKTKVRACYDTIPAQLARENKKFKYSAVEKKATSRKYGYSIEWLIDANMAYMCKNVEEPAIPTVCYEKDSEFKLYLNDTGLLMAMYGYEAKKAVLNGTIKGNAKGGIYENFIFESLIKKGYRVHYFKPNDSMELEFIIEKDGVIPIEVKAGNTATVSLNKYIELYDPRIAYKFADGNIGRSDTKLTLPHYMILFI